MTPEAKQRSKAQKRCSELRDAHGYGRCWVCGSTSGVKAGRNGYAVQCKRCQSEGRTNSAVEEYRAAKAGLGA